MTATTHDPAAHRATIPTGITGLLLEHTLRTMFANPLAAAIFSHHQRRATRGGEWLQRGVATRQLIDANPRAVNAKPGRRLDTLECKEAGVVGVAQAAALFADISRSGITMIARLAREMDHEDAARFSFLLATPTTAAAGLYKIPDLFGHPATAYAAERS